MKTRNRPQIPPALRQPSLLGAAGVIGHALGLFLVPAALARLSFALPIAAPLRVTLLIPLILLAGQGLHMLAFLGHEGFHFSLHKDRTLSGALGALLSAMVPLHLEIGFAISHWNHHKFTNGPQDPDAGVFRRYRTFLERLFFARASAELEYLVNTLRLAAGRPLPFAYKFPLDARTVRRLAWWNLGAALVLHAAYVAIAILDPLTGLVSIGLPFLAVALISGLRPYIEHAGTEIGELKDTRTRTSPILTALYCGTNYHLEHHLYPNIPCYRLPEVHRLLAAQGFLEGAPVEESFLGSYRHAMSEAQYPAGEERAEITDEAWLGAERSSG